MKYRFRPSDRNNRIPHGARRYRLRGRQTLQPLKPPPLLWEQPLLPPPKSKRPLLSLRRSLRAMGTCVARFSQTALERMAGSRETLWMLGGTLCAALAVTATVGIAVTATLFGQYARTGRSVAVPDCLSQNAESLLHRAPDGIVYELSYQLNDAYPAGTVISQSPSPGVLRRVYGREDAVTVTLTVAKERPLYTLAPLAGRSQRDAVLELKRERMTVSVAEEYSDRVAPGTVLRTEPQAGEHLAIGTQVTLFVSKGAQIRSRTVPDLLSLSETAARRLIEEAGLTVSEIHYLPSNTPVGTVMSQSVAAGTSLPEGSALSFTVSLGSGSPLRTVPDLTGLSLSEAVRRLREVGLTVGTVDYLSHAAPSGTVIAQTPPSGSPITSAVTSVDLIVST